MKHIIGTSQQKKKPWETIYIEIDSSLSIMPVIATNAI